MKKFLSKILATALTLSMGIGIAYAWYVVTYMGKLQAGGIKPATPASNVLELSESGTGQYSNTLTVSTSTPLYPCKLDSDGAFKNDIGSVVTLDNQYIYSINVKFNSVGQTSLRVSGITVTGTGKDDEINKSLRVTIQKGEEKFTYSPLRTSDFTHTFSPLIGSDNIIVVRIWYDGTDDANTSSNALLSTGAVQINIQFEAQ